MCFSSAECAASQLCKYWANCCWNCRRQQLENTYRQIKGVLSLCKLILHTGALLANWNLISLLHNRHGSLCKTTHDSYTHTHNKRENHNFSSYQSVWQVNGKDSINGNIRWWPRRSLVCHDACMILYCLVEFLFICCNCCSVSQIVMQLHDM